MKNSTGLQPGAPSQERGGGDQSHTPASQGLGKRSTRCPRTAAASLIGQAPGKQAAGSQWEGCARGQHAPRGSGGGAGAAIKARFPAAAVAPWFLRTENPPAAEPRAPSCAPVGILWHRQQLPLFGHLFQSCRELQRELLFRPFKAPVDLGFCDPHDPHSLLPSRPRPIMVVFKKIKSFEVVFTDPEKVYCSGEKVAGRVTVEVCEVTRVKAVRVLACGVAKVLWLHGSQQCKQTLEYLRYEDTLLLEDQPTGENEMVIMRPGNKYEYKFGFELPQGPLGTSFKGKYGHVDYWVKAFLDRPSQPTQETKKSFEVVDLVDINTPDLMAPVSAKKEKKVSCMFIPDGRVSVSARIDRKGFCEGDEISIHADFENTCSRIVVPKAAIVARHTYLANGQTKVLTQKLSSVRGNHIISGTCASWRGKSLRVQKIRPSILGCNILRVEYFLLIYVSVPGSKKVILDLPLVIGSRSGLSSRTSSMASQTSSEMSWVDLNLPDTPEAPPCYMDIIPEDHRLESPTTPLLDDTDGSQDSPIFMYAPEFKFIPPPTYTEVDPCILNNNVQ